MAISPANAQAHCRRTGCHKAPVATPEVTPTSRAVQHLIARRTAKSHTAIVVALWSAWLSLGSQLTAFGYQAEGGAGWSPTAAAPAPTSGASTPTIPEKSVAVLPFVDMSEKKDQEYLADGMTEEIIDLLESPGFTCSGANIIVLFQGKVRGHPNHCPQASCHARIGRQRAQIRKSFAHHGPANPRRQWISHLV